MKIYYAFILVIAIIIYFLFDANLWKKNTIKFMSISELIEFNMKLFFINNAGITYAKKYGSKLLDIMVTDPILIKMHRRLTKKYGKIVLTHIISNTNNYYILDTKLAKKILYMSPEIFEAGKIKDDFFKKFMPHNLGISKCPHLEKCPWKKRRTFNENVLGTNKPNPFFSCINVLIQKNIKTPLLNINDFKESSFDIVSDLIYGSKGENKEMLKKFVELANSDTDVKKTSFNDTYIKHLHNSYKTAPKCSLLYYANLYKNDNLNVIDDQLPHWFGPFIFIISFLIPNILCIILNNKDLYKKIKNEINYDYFDIYSKTTLLHYCVIEHIRLFNTINVNIQRTVNKNIQIDNIQLKKNDQIFMLFSSILRDENKFKNPDEFLPNRWGKRDVKEQEIVFGIGPQICPSKQISPFLYKTIIRHLLISFNYSDVKPKIYNKELFYINPYDISFSI